MKNIQVRHNVEYFNFPPHLNRPLKIYSFENISENNTLPFTLKFWNIFIIIIFQIQPNFNFKIANFKSISLETANSEKKKIIIVPYSYNMYLSNETMGRNGEIWGVLCDCYVYTVGSSSVNSWRVQPALSSQQAGHCLHPPVWGLTLHTSHWETHNTLWRTIKSVKQCDL